MFVIVCSSTSCSWSKWETVFYMPSWFFFTKCLVFLKRSVVCCKRYWCYCLFDVQISDIYIYIYIDWATTFCLWGRIDTRIYTQTLGFPHRQSPLSQHRNGMKREFICKLWPMKRLAVELPAWAVYFYIPRWEFVTLREVHGIPGIGSTKNCNHETTIDLIVFFKCLLFSPRDFGMKNPVWRVCYNVCFSTSWKPFCALDCTIWGRIMETEEEEPPTFMIRTSESFFSTIPIGYYDVPEI